jgi:hypothetical protein
MGRAIKRYRRMMAALICMELVRGCSSTCWEIQAFRKEHIWYSLPPRSDFHGRMHPPSQKYSKIARHGSASARSRLRVISSQTLARRVRDAIGTEPDVSFASASLGMVTTSFCRERPCTLAPGILEAVKCFDLADSSVHPPMWRISPQSSAPAVGLIFSPVEYQPHCSSSTSTGGLTH